MKYWLVCLAACAAVPPVARKEPHPIAIFGESLSDDYYWLRNKGTPEVEKYLRAENEYADRQLDRGLQEVLYREMLSRVQEDDTSAPFRIGRYEYWYQTTKGAQYPVLWRKAAGETQQLVLDEPALAAGRKFFSVGSFQVSDDGGQIAYSTDETGYRQYKLHVRDLRSGKEQPEVPERVDSFVWSRDGLFYVVEDPVEKRPFQLYRFPHELLYEEKAPSFSLSLSRSRSKDFVFLTSASLTTSEVRFMHNGGPLLLISARVPNREYYVDARGTTFWIRANDQGRNFRLVTASVDAPERWREVLAQDPQVMLEDFDVFRDFIALVRRANALPQIAFLDPESGAVRAVRLDDADYEVEPGENREYAASSYRIRYQSLKTPLTDLDVDPVSLRLTTVKVQPVPNYNASDYVLERRFVTARDGAQVPIALLYRRGTVPSRVLLDGYGAYGYSYPDDFRAPIFSLVDRGVAYAVAHIRGGGEWGKSWHDDGRMMHKRNTFNDYIDCAESLRAQGYHSIGAIGRSAGGLLMGDVLNERPDLFAAAIVKVPFVDLIDTMLDESLPETVEEFEEWGNPKIEEQYRYMRSYSPYDNIGAHDYPPMLVTSSYNDSQVGYWEPAKYVARLRATKSGTSPLLFKIDLGPAGHGGSSGRYDRLHESALDLSFLLEALAR